LPENWPIYPDPHSSPPLYLVIKGWPHDGGLPTRFRTEPEEINKRQNIQTLKTYTLELLNGVPTTQSSKTSSMFKKFDYHSKLYDSSTDKVKYYLSSVFKITPDDILYINLPKHLSFLYFIIRPFRLTQKYIKKSLFRQF